MKEYQRALDEARGGQEEVLATANAGQEEVLAAANGSSRPRARLLQGSLVR